MSFFYHSLQRWLFRQQLLPRLLLEVVELLSAVKVIHDQELM
jgi:hypothetical protein